MERILFGKVINSLTLKQASNILNEKYYNKSLQQFKIDFIELEGTDCKSEGIFKEYSKIEFKIEEELKDYTMFKI